MLLSISTARIPDQKAQNKRLPKVSGLMENGAHGLAGLGIVS